MSNHTERIKISTCFEDEPGEEYEALCELDMPLRSATDALWSEYAYRQGHATARAVPLEAADLSTGAIWSRKRYKHAYAVDEEWQRYRVWLLFGQGLGQRHESALNVNETPIELGMLFGVRIWVRLERVTPDSGR